MHKPAVNVGVEKIGHGEHGAVTKGTQVAHWTFPQRSVGLLLRRVLRTVVQQVHEQREISANRSAEECC